MVPQNSTDTRIKSLFTPLAFKKLSLKNKLLVTYLIMAVIPIIIIGTISYMKSSRTIIRQTEAYASLMIGQINKDIDAYIDKFDRITYFAYSNIEVQQILESNHLQPYRRQLDNRDKMHQFLLGICVIDLNIDGVYIYTKEGELFHKNISEDSSIHEHYTFQAEPWYDEITKEDAKTMLIPIHLEQKYHNQRGVMNLSYIRAIKNIYNGRYLGFILVDINKKAIDEIIGETSSKMDGRILIIDENDTIIYDSEDRLFGIHFKNSGLRFEKNLKDYDTSYSNMNDNHIMLTNRSKQTGWTVMFITPTSQIRQKVYEIGTFTIFAAIFCALIFLIISTVISLSISRPVNKLKKAISLVEGGDLDVIADIGSNDEIGQLSRSFNKMVLNIKGLVKEVYETQLKKKEAELSALQSQINPHFMYNTLETVNMMAILEGNFEISDVLTSFSSILRFNLDNKSHIISIEKEMKYVSDYLNIQKVRYKKKFNVRIEMEPEIEKYRILKLTVQPLVENALYHGITEKEGTGTINIVLKKEEDRIRIVVADDGIGMTEQRLEDVTHSLEMEEALSKKGSIGLNNINERIKLYFGSQYGLKISGQYGVGTRCELLIPANLFEKGDEMHV